MTEMLTLYEPGNRFGTLVGGVVRIWEVLPDGTLVEDSDLRHTMRGTEGGEST